MTEPLTSETLRALREKAEKATPGPWIVTDPDDGTSMSGGDGICVETTDKKARERVWLGRVLHHVSERDAPYLAACDPQTVLRLVDELERLRAENERQRKDIDEQEWTLMDEVDA